MRAPHHQQDTARLAQQKHYQMVLVISRKASCSAKAPPAGGDVKQVI
jgi:hypothetical protein